MKYLKLFQKQTDYQSFIESDSFITPNVSFAKDERLVFYNPLVLVPNNVITYTASNKLSLYLDEFNNTIVSHDFVDGVGTIVFEEDVTSIGNSAFNNCFGLTSIVIPDSVTSIGSDAFYACINLTSIVIPDSVTSIGNSAFLDCQSLTSVTIGSGVTSIGNSAFSNCALTSIVIPDSVTSIEDWTFFGCGGLTSIDIPDSVTSIGEYAFSYCDVTSIVIPDSVTSIGNYAFDNCYILTSVTIGTGVTSIGDNAFGSCSGLTSITCYAPTAPSIGDSTFSFIEIPGVLYYPSGSDYSSWMSTDKYYLGYYGWTGQEITD